ncbi:MAG TPA: hypothetical protein VNK04_13455 [Gemmataceae bacterium]|nr:hypothetical protein [Gemmataceae bacterium]
MSLRFWSAGVGLLALLTAPLSSSAQPGTNPDGSAPRAEVPIDCPLFNVVRCRGRRELTDGLLLGIHPATVLLHTRLVIEFDGASPLPVLAIGEQHLPAGALVCQAVKAAGAGGFLLLLRACWGIPAGARPEGAVERCPPTAPRLGGPIIPFYERLPVVPVEVEELPVAPVEIDWVPVIPVEPALAPFLRPQIEVHHVPDNGSAPMHAGRVGLPQDALGK